MPPAHLLLEGDARRQLELQLLNRTLTRDLKGHGEAAPGRVTKKCRRLHQWTIRLLKAENPPPQSALIRQRIGLFASGKPVSTGWEGEEVGYQWLRHATASKPDLQDRRTLRAQLDRRAVDRREHPIEGKIAHGVLKTGVIEMPQRAQPFRGQALHPNQVGLLDLAGADQTIKKRPQLFRERRGRASFRAE